MARIEYLINNPQEVELSDLDLLNTEIEKYPYFYSLRALKLLALKKSSHTDYENELQLTSVFNNDRKQLYTLLHPEFNVNFSNFLKDAKVVDVIASNNENDSEVENDSNLSDPNDVIIDEMDLNTPSNETEDFVTSSHDLEIEDSELKEEISQVELLSTETDDDSIETIESSDEINLTKDILLETNINLTSLEDVKEESLTIQAETSENITEDSSNYNHENLKSVHDDDINAMSASNETVLTNKIKEHENIHPSDDFSDHIIIEPTIESIIEDFKLQEQSMITEEIGLVEFDLPEVKTHTPSIENSLEIAQEVLEKDSIIVKALEETKEIEPIIEEHQPVIEQVDLINRSKENVITDFSDGEKVTSIAPFQILNPMDEVKGGYQTVEYTIPENHSLSTLTDQIVDEDTEMDHPIHELEKEEIEQTIEKVVEKEDEAVKITSNDCISTENITPSENKNVDTNMHSFSFNDWLKLPSTNSMEAQTEKEHKFQIIDDFLEKNPKIKPLKKQEVPEGKVDTREIKNTDFSDLMTETLAQIYIEQKQYEKAIKAYKILILKYPEKNSLFANQIKEIENLKNSK